MSVPNAAPSAVEADPKKPWKAIVGAVIAFLGLLWASLEGRQDQIGNMSWVEWASVLVPTIVTFGAVYSVPNPLTVKRNAYGERGYGAIEFAIGAVVLIILVVVLLRVI